VHAWGTEKATGRDNYKSACSATKEPDRLSMIDEHLTTDVLVLVLVLELGLVLEPEVVIVIVIELEGLTIPGDQGHSTTTLTPTPLSRGE
jgi:hypothetical protein